MFAIHNINKKYTEDNAIKYIKFLTIKNLWNFDLGIMNQIFMLLIITV